MVCGKSVLPVVDMRGRSAGFKSRWQRRGYNLDCGFGIAKGYATIGAIGFKGRLDYSAIGTVSNLFSRLCGNAMDCQILVSQRVLGGIGDLLEIEPLDHLKLKGISRPVSAFNVAGLKT